MFALLSSSGRWNCYLCASPFVCEYTEFGFRCQFKWESRAHKTPTNCKYTLHASRIETSTSFSRQQIFELNGIMHARNHFTGFAIFEGGEGEAFSREFACSVRIDEIWQLEKWKLGTQAHWNGVLMLHSEQLTWAKLTKNSFRSICDWFELMQPQQIGMYLMFLQRLFGFNLEKHRSDGRIYSQLWLVWVIVYRAFMHFSYQFDGFIILSIISKNHRGMRHQWFFLYTLNVSLAQQSTEDLTILVDNIQNNFGKNKSSFLYQISYSIPNVS